MEDLLVRATSKKRQVVFTAIFLMTMSCVLGQTDLQSLLSYPSPANLTGGKDKLAWTFNEAGKRNIYVAQAPDFEPRRLTSYMEDDGQELTQVLVSHDGKWVVYVRGGEHGGNWSLSKPANPQADVDGTQVELWSVPFGGGDPILLAPNASHPVLSPTSDKVVYTSQGERWIVNIDGQGKRKKLFADNGTIRHLDWSADGKKIAFTSDRGAHSFIGVFELGKQTLAWISPDFKRDSYPKFSPQADSLVFVRRPANSKLNYESWEWEIRVADLSSPTSSVIWEAPQTKRASFSSSMGRSLQWAAKDKIVFRSYHDGWQHLYSISPKGGKELLLTPGDFMVEEVRLNQKRDQLIFSANTGKAAEDIDRRHIGVVTVDRPKMKMLTSGEGAETSPVFLNNNIAFLSSTPSRPPLPARLKNNEITLIAKEHIPADFPTRRMVSPSQVIFNAKDGTKIHGQVFDNKNVKGPKPAIVFIHGGPSRQMMLSWDHRSYYAHTYAMNQFLANQGYIVLSVNYRLGIGYGYEFDNAENAGRNGASEYQDILAAGEWLANHQGVDPDRIGVYGGSYGGYLTALALGKNSDLFAAGVDIHGVHYRVANSVYKSTPDAELADKIAWKSSPVAYVEKWRSPVLLIHADDDRNVGFGHSIDLAQRLERQGVYFESLVIPNDTHHWMLHENLLKISRATVDFFNENLK